MKHLAYAVCAAFVFASTCTSTTRADTLAQPTRPAWNPVEITMPARNVDPSTFASQAETGRTIPFFTNAITSPLDGKTYTFRIAGSDPSTAPKVTIIHYLPIALRVHFADGTVLDPSKPACGDTVPVMRRFFESPLFVSHAAVSNGIYVGTTQLTDAFQRAEFWRYVYGSNYHVLLRPSQKPLLVDVTAPKLQATYPGSCAGSMHRVGEVNINDYDAILRSIMNRYLPNERTIPILVSYNVAPGEALAITLGYHSAYAHNGGTVVYATGSYLDPNIFGKAFRDIDAMSHELAEVFNDPFTTNATPPWGNVGQVAGCQNTLEVGDPLTGTAYTVDAGGFRYHPQESAFFAWFFRTPSFGTRGLYSYNGTFTSPQGTCQ